jgi:hypothetical protein
MWRESGTAGAGMHLGLTSSGELAAEVPVVPNPESRLFSIGFSLAVTSGAFLFKKKRCHQRSVVQLF